MNAPSGRQVRVTAGDDELVVVEVGGGIRSYTCAGSRVIDGYEEDEMCSGARGQLLAPWPNRLGDGRYRWEGRDLQTPLSEPERGNAIHGLVRWMPFTVADVSPGAARMEYRLFPQPGWPWTIDVAVSYRLAPGDLEVRTTLTNQGPGPAPVGFGWHPYLFAFGGSVDDAVLTVPASTAYSSDERGLPTGRYPVEGTDLDFRAGRVIGPARLDVAFTGLERGPDGRAVVTFADGRGSGTSTRLWIDGTYTHLMLFSGDTLPEPARRRKGLGLEPMTGAPDMLRSGDGRVVLDEGGSLDAAWGLTRP